MSRLPLAAAALAGVALALPASAAADLGGQAAPPELAATGGAGYGQAIGGDVLVRAVASRFSVAPRTLTAGQAPRVQLRFDQPGGEAVTARIAFRAVGGRGSTVSVALGRVAVNEVLSPTWPSAVRLAPGRYAVSLHATDADGRALARTGSAGGRATLTVKAAPKPQPARPTTTPTPAPATTTTTPVVPVPATAATPTTPGTFPVVGRWSWGDPFGVARSAWTHQGQDVLAASGTPIVAPVAGTISTTGDQPSAAGLYVVLTDAQGRGMFFAHCLAGSVAVRTGQAVARGASLCAVGATGDASGPHLHFELWPQGWRISPAAKPVDPAPQLRAWAG